ATSCDAAAAALSVLARVNHSRYGTCAAAYDSALGPCHTPARTSASTALNCSAVAAYSALSSVHVPAAASSDAGPGPLLSNAECNSGGEAIQIGAVIGTTPRAGKGKPDQGKVNEYDCRYQLGANGP